MVVMKFGGSSVATAERIRRVAEIVQGEMARTPVVVVSAMGDTTDHLIEAGERALAEGREPVEAIALIEAAHREAAAALGIAGGGTDGRAVERLLEELRRLLWGIALIRELTGRTRDYLVSFGERLSARIVAGYFAARGFAGARAFDAWDLGFVSDSAFTGADLLPECWELIPKAALPLLDAGTLPVVTGFIARDGDGNITTLGRGGSDLTATMLAAACGADEVQVWKDVDGILTADPRIVPAARPVERVTYEAAAELAYFGAQVLHPRAMQPCMRTGTPVLVKNSYNPAAPGTRVVADLGGRRHPLEAITCRRRVTLVDIVSTRMIGQPGFLAEVFSCFARQGLSVDMVATSEVSVSLTLEAAEGLRGAERELSRFASVEINGDKAIVTIVGDVSRSSEILARTFRLCEILGVRVQMLSQGASKVNISFIVDDGEAEGVVRALHTEFFEERAEGARGRES